MKQMKDRLLQMTPIEVTISCIGSKWKPAILRCLFDENTLRFSQLERQLFGVTRRILTQQLRELEQDGLIERTAYPEVPPRVEYTLTEYGKSAKIVLDHMFQWGVHHLKKTVMSSEE